MSETGALSKRKLFYGTTLMHCAFILAACGGGGSSSSTPTPPPPPVNSNPTVSNVDFQITDGESLNFTLSGTDSDGSINSCSIQSQVGQGEITGTSPDLVYSNNGFVGTTSFTYFCTDNDGANSNIATVTITVNAAPTGFFIDSAVAGLRYVSGEITGVTDGSGEFNFSEETIQFFVGNLFIGEADVAEFITPDSLSDTLSSPDAAGNIAQFLQSLDEDSNADNGIFISDETIEAYTTNDLTINFDLDEFEFQMATDVSTALSSLPTAKVLLPRNQTDSHLQSNLAVLRTDPIDSNLLASTYFGGRNLDQYINSILSSAQTNEFNYISGFVNIFEENSADLPIPNSDTYSSGDQFIVAVNSNLTELAGSLISPFITLENVYDGGVVLRSQGEGVMSEEILIFSSDLSETIGSLGLVCSPFDQENDSFQTSAQLIKTLPSGASLSVLCEVNDGINPLRAFIRTFDSNFQESAVLELSFQASQAFRINSIIEIQENAEGDFYVLSTGFREEETELDDLSPETFNILSKHSPNGSLLSTITFGSENENASEDITALQISPNGEVVIAGTLFFGDNSQNNEGIDAGYPQTSEGAIKPDFDNLRDGFVAVYDSDLNDLEHFTFIGGDNFVDGINSMNIDTSGNIHLAGLTLSNDIPITDNAIQNTVGSNSSYYMNISGSLDEILYATYFGDFQSRIQNLSIAADGSVFVAGPTTDSNLPLTGGETFDGVLDEPFNPNVFNEDLFISRIWPNRVGQ